MFVAFDLSCFSSFVPCRFLTDRVDVHPHGGPEREREGARGAAAGQLLPHVAALFAGR